MTRVIALLPMKANSQRVPGKNFRVLGHKPLYQWILDTLLKEEAIDKVIINTDAEQELLESGFFEHNRVEIHQRPMSLRGDLVSMNKIIAHDIAHNPADTYIMTHTTNPFLSIASIQSALDCYKDGLAQGYDSLFTVDKIQMRFYRSDASPINHDPNNLIQTQDLEPYFSENSNLYIFSAASFNKTNARIGASPRMFETPKFESIDIDTEEDWDIANAIASLRPKL